jgi:hypothetical protein
VRSEDRVDAAAVACSRHAVTSLGRRVVVKKRGVWLPVWYGMVWCGMVWYGMVLC